MPKPAPYDFMFDYLPAHTVVKAQFGMHYCYLNKKLMLMLRKTDKKDGLNGIWLASSNVHHQSLSADIPALGDFLLDTGETYDSHWRFLREDDDDFEQAAIRVCEMISRRCPDREGHQRRRRPVKLIAVFFPACTGGTPGQQEDIASFGWCCGP